jgi:hypothetical protein
LNTWNYRRAVSPASVLFVRGGASGLPYADTFILEGFDLFRMCNSCSRYLLGLIEFVNDIPGKSIQITLHHHPKVKGYQDFYDKTILID